MVLGPAGAISKNVVAFAFRSGDKTLRARYKLKKKSQSKILNAIFFRF